MPPRTSVGIFVGEGAGRQPRQPGQAVWGYLGTLV